VCCSILHFYQIEYSKYQVAVASSHALWNEKTWFVEYKMLVYGRLHHIVCFDLWLQCITLRVLAWHPIPQALQKCTFILLPFVSEWTWAVLLNAGSLCLIYLISCKNFKKLNALVLTFGHCPKYLYMKTYTPILWWWSHTRRFMIVTT